MRLGDLLLEKKLLTEQELSIALSVQKKSLVRFLESV